jgi:hypothetical protein
VAVGEVQHEVLLPRRLGEEASGQGENIEEDVGAAVGETKLSWDG